MKKEKSTASEGNVRYEYLVGKTLNHPNIMSYKDYFQMQEEGFYGPVNVECLV